MRVWPILAVFLLPAVALAATVYRSVDGDGKIVYTDQPPADAKRAKKLVFADLPSTPLPESVIRYRDELQKSMKKRLADAEASPAASQPMLFTTTWCGYCKQARNFLAQNKISYREYDIETPDGMRALVQSGVRGRGVPVLLWKNQKVEGYSRPAYEALFRE